MREDGMSTRAVRRDWNGQHAGDEAPLGELLKRLSQDSSHLVRQEMQLARTELKESATELARSGAKLGIAAAVALPGLLAVTAALVIGLGDLMDNYWLSALIVGAVMLGVAMMLMKRATAGLGSLKPEQTIETVREDVTWAKEETRRVKSRLTA